MNRLRTLAVVVLGLALVAGACGGTDGGSGNAETSTPPGSAPGSPSRLVARVPAPGGPQAASTYVAAVPGSRAYLAVVADGGDALVYVCDGDGVGQALSGRIQGGRLEAAVEGVQLTGTLTATGIAGQLILPGSAPVTFTAPPAVEGRTGLYRRTKSVNGTEYVSWWIRSDQGLKGTATTVGGKAGFDAETAATTLMNGC